MSQVVVSGLTVAELTEIDRRKGPREDVARRYLLRALHEWGDEDFLPEAKGADGPLDLNSAVATKRRKKTT